MNAYTYTIHHLASGAFYYGCRKNQEFDLGTKYFSSSKLIRRMIKEQGVDAFRFRIRKRFETYNEARFWETKLLRRVKAVSNRNCLNQAISSAKVPSKDSESEKQRRESISTTMKARWQESEFRANRPPLPKDHYRRIGELGRKSRFPEGYVKKKKKNPPGRVFKLITISKNGNSKQITQNQLSAYRKYGWDLVPLVGVEPTH